MEKGIIVLILSYRNNDVEFGIYGPLNYTSSIYAQIIRIIVIEVEVLRRGMTSHENRILSRQISPPDGLSRGNRER